MSVLGLESHMKTRDYVLTGILIAAGAVIRAVIPKMPVTPNFVIAMYCLAIFLGRPNVLETILIAGVSALLCQLTTGAPIPFINFISEPVGALVCFFLVKIPFRFSVNNYSLKPAIVTFIATFCSGTAFVLALSLIMAAGRYVMIATIVLPTAVANCLITQLCYEPLRRVLKIKDPAFVKVEAR
jgi:hypothetical protein